MSAGSRNKRRHASRTDLGGLADDGSVLGFDEGLVAGASGAGLGELADVELVEQPGDAVVDVLGAFVGVEGPDAEGEGPEVFEDGKEEPLAVERDGTDLLELGDLVDDVEDVEALLAVEVALVDGVEADEAGAASGGRPMEMRTGRVLSSPRAPRRRSRALRRLWMWPLEMPRGA